MNIRKPYSLHRYNPKKQERKQDRKERILYWSEKRVKRYKGKKKKQIHTFSNTARNTNYSVTQVHSCNCQRRKKKKKTNAKNPSESLWKSYEYHHLWEGTYPCLIKIIRTHLQADGPKRASCLPEAKIRIFSDCNKPSPLLHGNL